MIVAAGVTALTLQNFWVRQDFAHVHTRLVNSLFGLLGTRAPTRSDCTRSVEDVYRDHADFVWKALYRLGVAEQDKSDVFQQIFLVVQKNLATRRKGDSLETTWLFGIATNVARAQRRKAHRRYEELSDDLAWAETQSDNFERQDRGVLAAVLQTLELEQRVVFVMHELEEMTTRAIAAELTIPLGTVHSRLRFARANFEKACARVQAQMAREAHAAPQATTLRRLPFDLDAASSSEAQC